METTTGRDEEACGTSARTDLGIWRCELGADFAGSNRLEELDEIRVLEDQGIKVWAGDFAAELDGVAEDS